MQDRHRRRIDAHPFFRTMMHQFTLFWMAMVDYLVLGTAAFGAGLVDAVVGGGGPIQIPALFSVFPDMAPATLIGTNKLSAICGTGMAAASYARRVRIALTTAAPAALAALMFAALGAYTLTKVSPDFMRVFLPIVLIVVAVYTFMKKDFGSVHAPMHSGAREQTLALLVGAGIGFYDGFFGPGTGSWGGGSGPALLSTLLFPTPEPEVPRVPVRARIRLRFPQCVGGGQGGQ